ncbi:hypothetical protein CRG98_035764 [Punica granatum]|uniref:Uncharacterized protein n=1 Tax=Punica granatum TaxID=22663 RepID=A0A2I0IJS1_PUNGR|nr:hypothetical protein CRG98_035764 [Punica granatum]
MSSTADRLHLLVYPFLASGHIISFLDLIKRLLDHGLVVTVLVTPLNLSRFPVPLVPPLPTHPQCPRHHCPRACGLGSGAAPHEQLRIPHIVFSPSAAFALSVDFSQWRGLLRNEHPQEDADDAVTLSDLPGTPSYPCHGLTDRGRSSSVPADNVLACLDERGDHSLVYVCFGSRMVLDAKETRALADALEMSGIHFIWCSREDGDGGRHAHGDHGAGAAVHEGFNDWMGKRAQVLILRHRAEYPPDSVELARILASSVNVNGHMPNRARVRELREAATMAVGPAGSSDKGLDALIKALTELKSEGHQAVTCLPEKGD